MNNNYKTSVVLLGTGTPNANPNASGPSVAVVVNNNSYIVDFGPGVVRQAAKAYRNGIDGLEIKNLKVAFLTHLHSDHTCGFPDLIFTPWVLERDEPLKVFGPKGLKSMTNHILEAYKVDIDFRLNGFEKANDVGCKVEVTEIKEGLIYEDDLIKVEAFKVIHGILESYGFKFYTPDKTIVVSGDTAPCDTLAQKAKNCDILVHEVYHAAGLKDRDPKWQTYHSTVHTSSYELAEIASKVKPKILVLYHQLYHMNIQNNKIDIEKIIAKKDNDILNEIKERYSGKVISGKDLDVF